MFKALMLEEKDGKVTSSIQQVDEARLPEGDVTVAVNHSTLNYKDGLILLGQGRLVRQYPHIPGVDFAGTVLDSAHKDFTAGRCRGAHRLAGRRGALGRLCREGAGQRRLAGEDSEPPRCAPRHGDRHRGVHRDAGGDGDRGARCEFRPRVPCW